VQDYKHNTFHNPVGEGERERAKERQRHRVTHTYTYTVWEVLFFYNASKLCCGCLLAHNIITASSWHPLQNKKSTSSYHVVKQQRSSHNRKNQEEAEE
jgi:hypothetical protein